MTDAGSGSIPSVLDVFSANFFLDRRDLELLVCCDLVVFFFFVVTIISCGCSNEMSLSHRARLTARRGEGA